MPDLPNYEDIKNRAFTDSLLMQLKTLTIAHADARAAAAVFEAALDNTRQIVEERDAIIAERDATIVERDAALQAAIDDNKLPTVVVEADTESQQLLVARDAQIAELQKIAASRQDTISAYAQRQERLEGEVNQTKRENGQLRTDINTLRVDNERLTQENVQLRSTPPPRPRSKKTAPVSIPANNTIASA